MDRYPVLYWCSLVLAIIVSICSLTYWVYKFIQWRQRRYRRLTRWQRSRQQQQDRLARARVEHQEVEALAGEVAAELTATSALWHPIHRRHLMSRLKQLHARQAALVQETAQLESQLAELDLIAARELQPAAPERRSF